MQDLTIFSNQSIIIKSRGKGIIQEVIDKGNNIFYCKVDFPDKTTQYRLNQIINDKTAYFENDEIQKLAIELVNKPILSPPSPPPPTSSHHSFTLKKGVYCGTCAQSIYSRYCELFGWDEYSKGLFGRQQKLYGNKVAGECSVWFIAHSNKTGDRSNRWSNVIKGETIEEEYDYNEYYCNDGDIRIVFYKEDNKYYFAGVYKQESEYRNERRHIVIVYRRIASEYSVESRFK